MRSDSLPYRVLRFLTSRQFLVLSFALIAIAVGLRFYAGARSETIEVNPNDKASPQYPYRKDEFALLQIALDKLIQAESEKRYDDIYSRMASRRFQRNVPRRVFLKMTNCVEEYLGDVVSYDRNNNGFNRKRRNGRVIDLLQLHVERSETSLEEQMVFEWDGVDVKVGGLYWMTNRPSFHHCIGQIRSEQKHLKLEQAGALNEAAESTEKESTEIQGKADEENAASTAAPTVDNASATTDNSANAAPGETELSTPGHSPERPKNNNDSSAAFPKPSEPPAAKSKPDSKPEKDAPTGTVTLQEEAGKQTSITDFNAPVNEGAQPGESAHPPE